MLSAINTSNIICDSLYKDSHSIHPLYYKHTGIGNWFEKDLEFVPLPSFDQNIFPDQLQVEYSAKKSIQAKYVLTSKRHYGIHRILTGLRPTVFNGWYYGDIPVFKGEKLTKNLILIEFSPDCTMFRIYFIDGYYPKGKNSDQQIHDMARMYRSTVMKYKTH
jgi:hypothetical protein